MDGLNEVPAADYELRCVWRSGVGARQEHLLVGKT